MWEAFTRWLAAQFTAAQTAIDSVVAAAIPSPPSAVVAAAPCSTLVGVVNEGAWIGRFVPLGFLAVAVGVIVVGVAAAIVIRVIRIGASFATFGGGA